MSQKRVAAIHDISCFGKCSITVALPIISAAGIETAVIPTAVLSTHTGGFTGYTLRDLSDDIVPVAEHWKKEGISVDAVYTGYLCSKQQIDLIKQATKLISNDGTVLITDPVMADNGCLYAGFAEDYPAAMLELCKSADIITPNITEAVLMLGKEYIPGPYKKEYIKELLEGLFKATGAKIVLTGVFYDDDNIGAAVYDGKNSSFVYSKRLDRMYHGTGDIFTSALTSAVLNGKSIEAAAQIAVDFTCGCIKHTMENDSEVRYGVNFESQIPNLIKYLEL